MHLTFLGTGSGTPTGRRNVSSLAVHFDDGAIWLMDCGEGTQHQAMRCGLRTSRIERILVTHLHGDHCYGLFGLLACMGIHGRQDPVEVAGPPGLGRLLETVAELSELHLPFAWRVSELPAQGGLLAPRSGWQVEAVPMRHRVTCLGWVLTEGARPGTFHPDRARGLGLPEGPLWGRLQHGGTVLLPDGRTVRPEQVCDPPRPGRKLVLLGDTADGSAALAAGQDCGILVCEATFDASRAAQAARWGHSTAAMTGDLARRMRAATLVLTHIGGRYDDGDGPEGVAALRAEAAAACPGTRVLLAEDLLRLDL